MSEEGPARSQDSLQSHGDAQAAQVSEDVPDKVKKEKVPARAWLILVIVYFASIMGPVAQFKIPALANWLMPQFGLDGGSLGTLMSCLSIIGVILAFPAAFIARRFGLKATTAAAIACLGLGTLVSVLGQNMVVLYVGRVIEGVGLGLIGVSAPSCISVWFPESRRGFALGIWATWFPLGSVITYNLAPFVANLFSWQAFFWLCIVLVVAALVLFLVFFHVPAGIEDESLGHATISQGLKLLKNPGIWILGASFFVFNYAQIGVINGFYNTFLETQQGLSAQLSSTMTSLISLISIVVMPLAGFISDNMHFSRKKYWVAVAYFTFFVGFLFAWRSGEGTIMFSWIFIIVVGIGSGLSAGVSRPMVPTIMHNTAAGATMGMGVFQFFQNLGPAVGSPVFGWGYETLGWQTASNVLVLPVCAFGVIFALLITTKRRPKGDSLKKKENSV